ncbi:MAG: calcium/sodium antiporter [Fimbriimonadaceae bacterium]|nr:calcium/sodium antiporter [Alphaproteobacteria bacterium]
MSYLILIAGLSLLLVCGDFLVRGATGLAASLGIPAIIIGLTIVAFGTSAPELVVSVSAALDQSAGISLGNVIGSNIANILLVLGLPAMIASTTCDQPSLRRNTVYVIGTTILFIILCFNGPLNFWHGALLMTLLVLFLVETGISANHHRNKNCKRCDDPVLPDIETIDGVEGVPKSFPVMGLFILAGILGLPVGAHLTVDAAQTIARSWHVSEATIGLTVVALGTSLPELATTVIAAMRRDCGLALGNVLGSNLFNLLGVMGITAMITNLAVPAQMLRLDLWIMLAASLTIVPFVFKRRALTRIPAAGFVLAYVSYIAFMVNPFHYNWVSGNWIAGF